MDPTMSSRRTRFLPLILSLAHAACHRAHRPSLERNRSHCGAIPTTVVSRLSLGLPGPSRLASHTVRSLEPDPADESYVPWPRDPNSHPINRGVAFFRVSVAPEARFLRCVQAIRSAGGRRPGTTFFVHLIEAGTPMALPLIFDWTEHFSYSSPNIDGIWTIRPENRFQLLVAPRPVYDPRLPESPVPRGPVAYLTEQFTGGIAFCPRVFVQFGEWRIDTSRWYWDEQTCLRDLRSAR